jgi:hypothetical protein
LARVAEENPQPINVHTNLDSKATSTPTENLISMDTPRPSDELPTSRDSLGSDKENKETKQKPSSLKTSVAAPEPEELKTVEI